MKCVCYPKLDRTISLSIYEGCHTKSYILQISLTFISTSCANTHEITLQNNKTKRFYQTFTNAMFRGAAQTDDTTETVNVIIMSRTTHFLKYTPWCALHLWWRLTYFW